MVLEELDRPRNEASLTDSVPSSDVDPYAGDYSSTHDPSYIAVNGPPNQVYVNIANLPRAWSLQNLFGIASDVPAPVIRAIPKVCEDVSKVMQRPVRQEEADALAWQLAATARTHSYAQPIGRTIAMVLAYRGMSKFRFPGFTPGDKFNPESFGPIKGYRARLLWQFTRFGAYWFVGGILGLTVSHVHSLTIRPATAMMDPRLKELFEARYKKQQTGRIEGRPGDREVDTTAGPREGETAAMARQRQRVQGAQGAWKTKQEQNTSAAQQQHDTSATDGVFGAEYVDLGSANVAHTSMISDDRAMRSMEGFETKQRGDWSKNAAENMAPSRPQQQRQEHAPPTASAPKQGGSTWERLRQQAASGQGQNQNSPRAATPLGAGESSSRDSFSFLSSDEERELTRAEAQKEFDARIERERTGRDFDDRSAGGRRW